MSRTNQTVSELALALVVVAAAAATCICRLCCSWHHQLTGDDDGDDGDNGGGKGRKGLYSLAAASHDVGSGVRNLGMQRASYT